ncbi:hypothetical protein [Falsiroseomonas sp. HW251]|uniref:hypothetical protein n=1 Tax=Falsiroseomonas sp. HW251 TaxID=3390998 RepID=UPI003D314662
MAKLIDESDPRELLRAALPDCPPMLFRALARAGDFAGDAQFYRRLAAVARGPFADAFLNTSRSADGGRLAYYEMLARLDPAITRLQHALPENEKLAATVDSIIRLLRAHGALHEDDLDLPPGAGLSAVVRRLRAALARIPAPDPGFAPPPPFRLVGNTAELQRVGRDLSLCVALPAMFAAHHHINVVAGTRVYLTADNPPLFASLRKLGSAAWFLDRIVGPQNADAPPVVRQTLERDLAAAGLILIPIEPGRALWRLDAEARGTLSRLENVDEEFGDLAF